jgi:hypothetical protein
MPDYPTPPIAEILARLVEAVHQFDHWREIDSGCGGAGPFVMAHRALGLPLPPEVAEWIATSDDAQPPFPDPAGYPWSTNPYVLRPPSERGG